MRVHDEIARPGHLAAEEHLLPGCAAVFRAVDAAFLVRPVRVAERRDIDEIGIARMDADFGDVPRLREAEMRPRLARVGGLVDAIAMRDIATNRDFAHTDIDDVRVALRHRDGTDRGALEVAVGDVLPEDAAIFGLPDTATRRAHIEDLIAHGIARHRDDAATPEGADQPPFERMQLVVSDCRSLRVCHLSPLSTTHRRKHMPLVSHMARGRGNRADSGMVAQAFQPA